MNDDCLLQYGTSWPADSGELDEYVPYQVKRHTFDTSWAMECYEALKLGIMFTEKHDERQEKEPTSSFKDWSARVDEFQRTGEFSAK